MDESGELPPGWAWARLGDVCDLIGGVTVDAKRGGPDLIETPYLRVANVQRGHMDLREVKTIRVPRTRLEQLRLHPGDVLLNEGGDRDKVGRGWVWEGQIETCVFQNHIFRARPRDRDFNAYFLSHYLNEIGRSYFLAGAKQTTNLASLSLSKVADTPIAVAPAAEQVRIMAEVERLFTELDEAEAALGRARDALADYRASLLHAACTGALTAAWRVANPRPAVDGPALLRRILIERRAAWERAELARLATKGKPTPKGDAWKARYQEPTAPNADGLPALPDGWVWASLDQLSTFMTSGSRAWAPYYGRGSCVFVMAQNVRPGRFDTGFVQSVDPPPDDPERRRTLVGKDDLLVTIVGANTGDACRVDVAVKDHFVCQSVALIRPVCRDLSPYLELFLCAEQGGQAAFRAMMYGAGRPHLSFDQLRSVAVPLPPAAEVDAIMATLRAITEETAGTDEALSATETTGRTLRQSILHTALTGRLAPQDPADEPAAALLARLRAAPATPGRAPRRVRPVQEALL